MVQIQRGPSSLVPISAAAESDDNMKMGRVYEMKKRAATILFTKGKRRFQFGRLPPATAGLKDTVRLFVFWGKIFGRVSRVLSKYGEI